MTSTAERFRTVCDGFAARVSAVPPSAWESPTPCEGWVARDVLRHLVDWVPGFFAGSSVRIGPLPSVDDDPVGAWAGLSGALLAALEDPDVASSPVTSRAGTFPVEQAVATFVLPDVLVHTWDLARATGLDDRLDEEEVARAAHGLEQVDEELLVSSGHYGPRVPLGPDADLQARLLAATGRDPGWSAG